MAKQHPSTKSEHGQLRDKEEALLE